MGKLLERIVTERLNWWAENRGKLNNKHNGFRRGKSCMENLVELVTDVQIGRYKNTNTMAAFLDVLSAYDNVLYNPLISKLIQEECPTLIKYIESWMSRRRVKFIVDKEETEIRNVFKGLLQGAVLSPILYDIYINNIMQNITTNIKQIQFAGDIVMYVQDNKVTIRRTIIEEAVRILGKI